jgi:hypothetical protein
LGEKRLQVGIGLECQNDEIRKRCVNKGFSRKDYEGALAILKGNSVEPVTYVFLKPLFLTEKQAIEEAIATIEYAFKVGTEEVALESAFIQKGTIMEEFYKRGKYKPPWLWSVISVVKSTYHLGPVRIGGFDDEPRPIDFPRNCPECSSEIMKLFKDYRLSGDVKLFDKIRCECEEAWELELFK